MTDDEARLVRLIRGCPWFVTALRAGPPEALAQEGPKLLAEYAEEFELVLSPG